MAYRGPHVICDHCRGSFSRPADLRRHLGKGRCPGRAFSSAKRRHKPSRAKVIEVRPVRAEIVAVTPSVSLARPIVATNRDNVRTAPRPVAVHVQDENLVEAARLEADLGRSMNMTPEARAEIEKKIRELRRPQALASPVDGVTLWEQYHFLKALATRLDAGRGTERDRVMFEEGLCEYNVNYDRVRARAMTKGTVRFVAMNLLKG